MTSARQLKSAIVGLLGFAATKEQVLLFTWATLRSLPTGLRLRATGSPAS